MKDHRSTSWVVHIKELLTKYDLLSVFQSPPSKSTWKKQVKKSVEKFWLTKLKDEASQMATLEYLNTTKYLFGKLHPIWHYIPYNRTAIHVLQACTLVKFKVFSKHTTLRPRCVNVVSSLRCFQRGINVVTTL